MRKRPSYYELPIMPSVIAADVVTQTYTGHEISERLRNYPQVEEIEKRRQKMMPDEVQEFCGVCADKCREAYEVQAPWFEKVVKAKTNAGRDQLYIWVSHWLAMYLTNREGFLREE